MTYEYICTSCGHEWEAEQPISAEPLKKCPSCRRSRAKRQVSGGAGFILKGGGWYADGYASSKRAATSGGSSASTGSSTADQKAGQDVSKGTSDSKKPTPTTTAAA